MILWYRIWGPQSSGNENITPYSPLKVNRHFERACRLRLLRRRISQTRDQHEAGSKQSDTLWIIWRSNGEDRRTLPFYNEMGEFVAGRRIYFLYVCALGFPLEKCTNTFNKPGCLSRYSDDGRDSNFSRGKKCFASPYRPDRFWGLHTLLSNGALPRDKQEGAWS
jgi:hypothetical protein